MKVLVVSSKYPPEYSGSGLRAHNTYCQLSDTYGLQFDVITSSITSNQCQTYHIDGVRVQKIANKITRPFKRKKSLGLIKRVIQGIRYRWHWHLNYWSEAIPMFIFLLQNGSQYDIIHTFGNVTVTSVAISYAKISGKPLLVELVNLNNQPDQYEPSLISRLYGKGYPKQTRIVCLSERLKNICLQAGYAPEQIWCRPNPIPQDRFNIQDRPTKSPFEWPNLSQNDILIVQIAKFRPLKNQKFMIEVLARLPQTYKLVLAGPLVESGPQYDTDRAYYESVIQAIQKYQLEQRVLLIPKFIEKPEQFMKMANVYVVPSTSEAFGTPCIEAIACGTPVVVTEILGVFDQWVKPGINGYMCPLDPDQWAEKIQQAHNIPQETRQQASQEILEVASTQAVHQRYYENLISQVSPNV